jgi:hypothetical protein
MQPPPPGPPPYAAAPYAGAPYGPPHRSRRGPVLVVVAAAVLLVVAGGGLLYAYGPGRSDGSDKGFGRTPAACWLLSQAQVDAYVPGAVSGSGSDPYYCPWSKPVGAKGQTGQLTVAVEALPGDRPSVRDAKEQYAIRRNQANTPGTTIVPLSLRDESFMACGEPERGRPGSCKTYTRVRNVVFSLEFESNPDPGMRDPAGSVKALTAEAVRHLLEAG